MTGDLRAPLERPRGEQRRSAAAREAEKGRVAGAPPPIRIYDLYPSLIGPVAAWTRHLPRIAAMGFNWVYVNSFHQPGASGSLYAVSDPFRLNPAFRGEAPGDDDEILAAFVAAARQHGLQVMMDLSIAQLARDSVLVEAHPNWFRRRSDGALLSGSETDPGRGPASLAGQDLALLDYADPTALGELLGYWAGYLRHYSGLGFAGFVGNAADQLPADVWRRLIAGLKREAPESRFVANALGRPVERIEALAGAGFDYLFNSARWWDFRAGWLLEQQPRLSRIAPTIGFPEHYDGERVAAAAARQAASFEAELKFRLLFAAAFSAGWMMPVGYEYGFARRLDPIRSRPADWEEPRVDLSAFVAAVNAVKTNCPVLGREGALSRVTAPGASAVGLLRLSGGHLLDSDEALLLLLNPEEGRAETQDTASVLVELGGRFDRFADITPLRSPVALDGGRALTLAPFELRLFRGEIARREVPPPEPARVESHLRALARQRIIIEVVEPEIEGGRHPAKRVAGDLLEVSADIFAEGHDKLAACILYQEVGERGWHKAPMALVDNDRWQGHVPLARGTTYLYTIEAWRDGFASWRAEIVKKREAGQDIHVELEEGLRLVRAAAQKTAGPERERLAAFLPRGEAAAEAGEIERRLLDPPLLELMTLHGERLHLTRYPHRLAVTADRLAARYSAWYEMFPRSQSPDPSRSGTFDDVIARLPYVRGMGFDVLYFPPIHPIGRTNRKGRNNSLTSTPEDPGSPYAIGAAEGGHTAIHPELGTLADFRRLLRAAHAEGIEIALDFAVQCSLDHPWIREHPDWFDWRPDGSIKFAENPPKRYEDIVNVNFDKGFPALWYALRDVVLFWLEQGVRIFRVDNPHTKPVPFWEWLIGEVRQRDPAVIFLSEAFTRPKMMKALAKAGFNQSYTYFTWRNTKQELTEYLTELAQSDSRDYLRPNFFVNTPDINPFFLQRGGRPAFMTRAVLAATLAPAYGIYSGYELCEAAALPGREEYLDSEKYQIKRRDWDQPGNIRDYITRLNRIRHYNPALHDLANLRFYNAFDNDILLYGKMTQAQDNAILVAVNLDPHNGHGCDFEIPLWEFGLPDNGSLQAEDLLAGGSFWWHGKIQHLWLDPTANPAVILRIAPPGRAA